MISWHPGCSSPPTTPACNAVNTRIFQIAQPALHYMTSKKTQFHTFFCASAFQIKCLLLYLAYDDEVDETDTNLKKLTIFVG